MVGSREGPMCGVFAAMITTADLDADRCAFCGTRLGPRTGACQTCFDAAVFEMPDDHLVVYAESEQRGGDALPVDVRIDGEKYQVSMSVVQVLVEQ